VILRQLYSEFLGGLFTLVQESWIFTMVIDLFLSQFVLGRSYFWSRLSRVLGHESYLIVRILLFVLKMSP